jgi:phage gpG-like protein
VSALPTIQITFTPQAQAVLNRLQTLTPRILSAMARGMNEANEITVGVIRRDFLSYPKNGPTVPDGLRVITNRLRGSIRATKAVINGTTITSSIGTNVKYAALHEFGGTVKRVLKAGSVRLRTDKKGNLLRQVNGKLAVFAKNTHKLAVEKQFVGGKQFDAVYPARAPIRRGIIRSMETTREIVSRAILAAANGKGGTP